MSINNITSSIRDYLKRKKIVNRTSVEELKEYEYCPRCSANITLQKGYSNDLPYWECKGCGQMLINPDSEWNSDIVWLCDSCGSLLNNQTGFDEKKGTWNCLECGFTNKISESEIYFSGDEYKNVENSPYKGLSDDALIKLSYYQEEKHIDNRDDIILVRNIEDNNIYIKKILKIFNKSVYEYLLENPIKHMPKIYELFEGNNSLIVIEEYIEGKTIAELIDEGPLSERQAIVVANQVCKILIELHKPPKAIIHRDIKPSNVLIGKDKQVYLLDMNVAKWYDPKRSEDTQYMGTMGYAAPEQVGYGLSASSTKADIYAVGILLNVMLTGKYPKEERAIGDIWNIIEKSISLDAKDRFSAIELKNELERILRND